MFKKDLEKNKNERLEKWEKIVILLKILVVMESKNNFYVQCK
jgi:hypothetical protein